MKEDRSQGKARKKKKPRAQKREILVKPGKKWLFNIRRSLDIRKKKLEGKNPMES